MYFEAPHNPAEPSASVTPRPRRAREPRQTALARKRRLARIARQLAGNAGVAAPSAAERAILIQAAGLTLRGDDLRAALVRGEAVDGGELVRVASELRRVLGGLRRRAPAAQETELDKYLRNRAAEAAGK